MTNLMARIILSDKVSDIMSQQHGYKDWAECRANDYDLSETILKETKEFVKTTFPEVA
jgi:hypothetical protein